MKCVQVGDYKTIETWTDKQEASIRHDNVWNKKQYKSTQEKKEIQNEKHKLKRVTLLYSMGVILFTIDYWEQFFKKTNGLGVGEHWNKSMTVKDGGLLCPWLPPLPYKTLDSNQTKQ